MDNRIGTTRSYQALTSSEPVQTPVIFNAAGTSPSAALPPSPTNRYPSSALSRLQSPRQRGVASIGGRQFLLGQASGQGMVEQPMTPPATTLSQLPERVLEEILQFGDGPTLDTVLTVSRNFKNLTNAARQQQVVALAQRPGRITQEALPTRLELVDMDIANPNMDGILNTMQSLLNTQAGEPGPLMRNVQAHADLQRVQKAVSQISSLPRRINAATTDIGQCNAQQQSHGFGVRTYQNIPGAKYEGAFADGNTHGLGYRTFANGDRYEGALENGLMHGRGIYVSASGNRFEGALENGLMHGRGMYVSANGDCYEGALENNQMHGQGTLVMINGNRYEGEFENSKKHGHGTLVMADGTRYEGAFENSKKHGQGTLVSVDGTRREVRFNRGEELSD